MFSHKNLNSSDSINTWCNVSHKKTQKSCLNVFFLPVDLLSFHQNFDSCDAAEATPNTTLT